MPASRAIIRSVTPDRHPPSSSSAMPATPCIGCQHPYPNRDSDHHDPTFLCRRCSVFQAVISKVKEMAAEGASTADQESEVSDTVPDLR